MKFADDSTLSAAGIGKVLITRRDGKRSFISDVLFVPRMKSNLLSLGQLLEKGYVMQMEKKETRIYDGDKRLLIKAPLTRNRTFKVGIQTPNTGVVLLKSARKSGSGIIGMGI